MNLNQILLQYFRGREDHHAVQNSDGFQPVKGPPTQSVIERHLKGEQCAGFYTLTTDSHVYTLCWDFDGKHEQDWQARGNTLCEWLSEQEFEPLAEISQSGDGLHVWLFFDHPVPGRTARAFGQRACELAGVTCREIFPKQDELREGGLGNLVRYPLWKKSRFLSDLPSTGRVAPGQLERYLPSKPDQPPTETGALDPRISDRVVRLIQRGTAQRRWEGDSFGLDDPSRSGVAIALAHSLIRAYVPTDEVLHALLAWCDRHQYRDPSDRERWARLTLAKAYDWVHEKRESKSKASMTLLDAALEYVDIKARGTAWCQTGIQSLDEAMDGVGLGELAVVAARPGHGKSAFGLQWAWHQARQGRPVLIVSEEMSPPAIGGRSILRIWSGDPEGLSVPTIKDRVRRLFATMAPIHVVTGAGTIDRVEELVDQHVELDGVQCLVVDYAQLLRSRRSKSRWEEVAETSMRLRQLTTRHELATVALAQLNREFEKRGQRRIQLGDLGDSSQLERDADVVLGLIWPCLFNPGRPKDEYLIQILKRRNGPVRSPELKIKWDPSSQTLE